MSIDTIQDHILYDTISGSHAYGLAIENVSDIDKRGIFISPKEDFFGLSYTEQINDDTNDKIYYEIGRFIQLALQNNPNILELLYMPSDTIQLFRPILNELFENKHIFLSKKCASTFGGFAYQQIVKARGLNKKIVNPVEPERKSLLHFCFVPINGKSISIFDFLTRHNLTQEQIGLVAIPHCKNVYGMYTGKHYNGIITSENSNDVCLSPVEKDAQCIGTLVCNIEGYSAYCKSYKEYHEWVKNRNQYRYASNIEAGKGYDGKNLMHCFRILQMAKDIALYGDFSVKVSNREELLDIRFCKKEYDLLIQDATALLADVNKLFVSSTLPDLPDTNKANSILYTIRNTYYK